MKIVLTPTNTIVDVGDDWLEISGNILRIYLAGELDFKYDIESQTYSLVSGNLNYKDLPLKDFGIGTVFAILMKYFRG
jgi:hypothetical protein